MGYQPKSTISKAIMGCLGLSVLPALPLNAKEVLGAPKVEPIEILQVHGQQYRRATTMTKPGEAIILAASDANPAVARLVDAIERVEALLFLVERQPVNRLHRGIEEMLWRRSPLWAAGLDFQHRTIATNVVTFPSRG